MKLKTFFLVIFISSYGIAMLRPFLCSEKLNPEQAIERIAWAAKCSIEPFETYQNTFNVPRGYPVLGFIDKNWEVSNPQNWFAPTDRNAECDLPEGYQLIALCMN